MKTKMKRLKVVGALVILAVSMLSCDTDSSDNAQDLQAIADVFVRCKTVGENTVYAPAYYTYSNFPMKEVSVEGPTDSNIDEDLAKFDNKTVFRLMPGESDFSTTDVVNGIYQFKITAEDLKTYTISDKLLESRISPVKITEFTYDKSAHSAEIDWDNVENAHVYVVKIHDHIDGNLIYISSRLLSSNHIIHPGSSGWTNYNTVDGETYILGVYAYKFEAANATSGYDINCESVEYREIEW